MKKIFTLICAAALSLSTTFAAEVSVTPANVNELKDALNATHAAGDVIYIYLNGSFNLKSFTFPETSRNYHFVGVNDEDGNRAELLAEFVMPTNSNKSAGNTESDHFALTFENLILKDNNGVWSNSKHFINFKDELKHYADTLAFKNCEITEICRSFFRGEAQNKEADAGTLGVILMENCVFHNGFRQSNAMPMFYLAQPVNEVTFRNNTFYDLPYLNSIISMGNLTEATGLKDVKITFENNTVCAYSKSTLFSFASTNKDTGVTTSFIGTNSEIHIKNNFFLFPNWADDSNNRYGDTKDAHGEMTTATENPEAGNGILSDDEIAALIEKGTSLLGISAGYVQLQNNVLFGYKYPTFSEDVLNITVLPCGDATDDEEEFTSLTMESIPFAWTDFVDAKNDMFQINDQNPAYKAGKNEAPLGDINNYTDKVIKEIALNVKVEGSETVSFSISPAQEKYFSGNTVTITLNDHNNGLRTLNTFKGWSNGSEETTLQIELGEEDIELVATYEPAIENVVSYFDFNQTPAAGQNKLTAYNADVYAEGYEATATCMLRDTATVEGVLSVTSEYHAAAGTENRFNWRSGKFGEDAEDQKVCVLSRKSPAVVRAAETPDYIMFTFSTKDKKGLKFSAFCGTDNFGYKTQLADYSLDGTTWTNFAKVDLESRDAEYSIGEGKLWGWTELAGILPAEAENKDVVYVRVIGDVKGETVTNEVSEIDVETANMFEYVAAVLLTENNSADGIEEIAAEKNASKAAALYNLMGIRVNGNAKGMLIRENKKFIVK